MSKAETRKEWIGVHEKPLFAIRFSNRPNHPTFVPPRAGITNSRYFSANVDIRAQLTDPVHNDEKKMRPPPERCPLLDCASPPSCDFIPGRRAPCPRDSRTRQAVQPPPKTAFSLRLAAALARVKCQWARPGPIFPCFDCSFDVGP